MYVNLFMPLLFLIKRAMPPRFKLIWRSVVGTSTRRPFTSGTIQRSGTWLSMFMMSWIVSWGSEDRSTWWPFRRKMNAKFAKSCKRSLRARMTWEHCWMNQLLLLKSWWELCKPFVLADRCKCTLTENPLYSNSWPLNSSLQKNRISRPPCGIFTRKQQGYLLWPIVRLLPSPWQTIYAFPVTGQIALTSQEPVSTGPSNKIFQGAYQSMTQGRAWWRFTDPGLWLNQQKVCLWRHDWLQPGY